jgi:GNAT superfamily N-acetyltransferase
MPLGQPFLKIQSEDPGAEGKDRDDDGNSEGAHGDALYDRSRRRRKPFGTAIFARKSRTLRDRGQRESLSMSADATIRRIRPDEANSFRAIRLEALKANPEAFGSTFELEDKLDLAWFAGRLENSHVMGAFRDGELLGTGGFAIQQGPKNAHKGRLWGMYVRPSSRNFGVGRLLLSAVLGVARENVELIQLSVVRENRPARRLYESVGFLEFGMEPKASKLGDKYYDEAHMALDFSRPK